jgi:N-acetylglucosaminyldiphosphoundecaprenol N-acetyl-beta-D-mannosaminyltransferase
MMRATRFSEDVKVDLLSSSTCAAGWDDLSRKVYCVLGIPVDAIDMPALLHAVESAAADTAPFLISTPNLNFLIVSQRDAEFRETLLFSELCPADGMAIVWIARLMGLPIRVRVAGSDMLEALKTQDRSTRRVKLFLFGGAEGAVEAAAKVLNQSSGGLSCVGSIYPGFGTVEEMSQDHIITKINASHADFLIAALGAKKGQMWLRRNHDRLQIPVRAHLGAVINFEAGNVRRAPSAVRRLGLEWLWRIKEEPYLWRRYWSDGGTLLGLLLTNILPLAIRAGWLRLRGRKRQGLVIERTQDHETITLSLCGAATAWNADKAIAVFRSAVAAKTKIRINLSDTCVIDARFLGLLLMLRKRAMRQSTDLKFIGASSRLQTMFRLNGAGFLLALDPK